MVTADGATVRSPPPPPGQPVPVPVRLWPLPANNPFIWQSAEAAVRLPPAWLPAMIEPEIVAPVRAFPKPPPPLAALSVTVL